MTEVWAVSMVRDEADVIEGTLRHLADEEIDGFVVADNGSTDGTLEILGRVGAELVERGKKFILLEDSEVGYYQSRKMTELARRAASSALGAPWIIPFDADEVWYSLGEFRMGDALRYSKGDWQPAKLYNHLATSLDGLEDPDPFLAMRWRQREPGALPKVAFRWNPDAVIGMGNHDVKGVTPMSDQSVHLEIRHFPARSPEQFTRKAINGAEAYRATDLPDTFGAHWRSWGALIDANGPGVMAQIFHEHYWYLSPTDSGLIEDPAPYMRWR